MVREPGTVGDGTVLEFRRASGADLVAGRDVVRTSMGWRDGEPNEELFAWKHERSPFGRSPSWVAVLDGRVVGFRTFMRWRFLDDAGRPVTAVRAVDTATLPEVRGRGVFRGVTERAVEELTAEGVGLVFNTPNDQSRPGYLKMGWSVVGQLPLTVRTRSVMALPALRRARVPAERWSLASRVGLDAAEALADPSVADALLAHAPARGWRTERTRAYLAWRFGLEPLHYRLLLASRDPAEGGLVFRLRRRGPAVEAAVAEQLVPDARTARLLVRRILKETDADYAAGLHSMQPDGSAAGSSARADAHRATARLSQPPELAQLVAHAWRCRAVLTTRAE